MVGDWARLTVSAILSIVGAMAVYLFVSSWGVHFQYPLIRQRRLPARALQAEPGTVAPSTSRAKPSMTASFAVLMFYIIVAYIVLYGLALPLVPAQVTPAPMVSSELAILAMMMVALVRALTLLSSVQTYRVLLNAIVLTSGLVFFVAFRYPDAVTASIQAVTKPATQTPSLAVAPIALPFIALAVAASMEISWLGWIKVRRTHTVSRAYVDSIQRVDDIEEIGFFEPNIGNAYIRAVNDVVGREGIWELCWLAGSGQRKHFYEILVNTTAKRIAADRARIPFDSLDALGADQARRYLHRARIHLMRQGMFLLPHDDKPGRELFHEYFGFYPGKLEHQPTIEFMIINRQVLVSSWAAHSAKRLYEGNQNLYAPSVYCYTRDPGRINEYLKVFQAYWGSYLMSNIGATVETLNASCRCLLDVIIDRAGTWTPKELVRACKGRGIRSLRNERQVRKALQMLIDSKMVVDQGHWRVARDRNAFIWQDRWLRIVSDEAD
jgi:hypothetical protein